VFGEASDLVCAELCRSGRRSFGVAENNALLLATIRHDFNEMKLQFSTKLQLNLNTISKYFSGSSERNRVTRHAINSSACTTQYTLDIRHLSVEAVEWSEKPKQQLRR